MSYKKTTAIREMVNLIIRNKDMFDLPTYCPTLLVEIYEYLKDNHLPQEAKYCRSIIEKEFVSFASGYFNKNKRS